MTAPIPAETTHKFPLFLIGETLLFVALGCALLTLMSLSISGMDSVLGVFRLMLSVFFLLFAPGYQVIAALFPRNGTLDNLERLGLSIGVSIALIPLMSLLLDSLYIPLTLTSIVSAYLVLLGAAGVAATLIRWRTPASERFVSMLPRLKGSALSRSHWLIAGVMGIGSLLMIAAAVSIFARPGSAQLLTEFYLIGAAGLGEDYLRVSAVGEQHLVTAGIHNQEQQTVTYWIIAEDSTGRIGQSERVTLSPGERVEMRLPFSPAEVGENVSIQFSLYREGDTAPYRELRLFMEVASAA